MSDSNARETLDAKHEDLRERRIEAIKRWVRYIETQPPEKWRPQQNTVVDDQLDAAQHVKTSATHRQHVHEVAMDIMDVDDE